MIFILQEYHVCTFNAELKVQVYECIYTAASDVKLAEN